MTEETLDPRDWEELRSLGHRMLDDMFDYLRDVRARPAWQPPTAAARAVIAGPLPRDPSSAESVYDDFRDAILPFPTGNIHPRFWGWVMGTGTPFAMLADMLVVGVQQEMHLATGVLEPRPVESAERSRADDRIAALHGGESSTNRQRLSW